MDFECFRLRIRVFNTHTRKIKENHVKILGFDRADGDFTFSDGSSNGVSGNFDMIWFTFDSDAFKFLFTLNGNFIGTKTGNIGPHFVDEFTKSGDMRFTSGVVDDGGAR